MISSMKKLRSALVPGLAAGAALVLAGPAFAGVPEAPPQPVFGIPGGPHRLAAVGSYCWERPAGGLCADTIDPIDYAPTVRLPADADPIVRMGYPVRRVRAFIGGERIALEPLARRHRKFRLSLPERPADGVLEVYLFATYDRGDGSFAIKIASRGR